MDRFLSPTTFQAHVNRNSFAAVDHDDDGARTPLACFGGGSLSRSNSITGDEANLLKPFDDSIKPADGLSRYPSSGWGDFEGVPPLSPSLLTREHSYDPASVFNPKPQLGEGGGGLNAADAMGLAGFVGVEGGVTDEDLARMLFDPAAGPVDADALDVPAMVVEEEEVPMRPTVIPPEVVPNRAPERRSSRTTKPVVPMPASTLSAAPKSKSSRSKSGAKGNGKRKEKHAPAKRSVAKSANASSTVTVAVAVAVAASSSGADAHRLADKLCWIGAPRPADGTRHGEEIVVAGCHLVWDADFRSDGGSWTHPRTQPEPVAASDEVLASRKTDSRYDALAKPNRAAAMARLKAKRACGRVNGAPISHYRDRGEAANGRVRVGGRFVKKNTGGFVSQDQLKRKQKSGSR